MTKTLWGHLTHSHNVGSPLLLGVRSRRIATSSPSGSPSSDEDDDTSPLIKRIPRNISSVSNFLSLDGRDLSSAHMSGAMPLPFGHPDWSARQLFDVRTARPESARQDLEMVTSTRQVTRLPREHEHVMPPVALVNTTPGQPPILRIPLTDRLVASFLAQVRCEHIRKCRQIVDQPYRLAKIYS